MQTIASSSSSDCCQALFPDAVLFLFLKASGIVACCQNADRNAHKALALLQRMFTLQLRVQSRLAWAGLLGAQRGSQAHTLQPNAGRLCAALSFWQESRLQSAMMALDLSKSRFSCVHVSACQCLKSLSLWQAAPADFANSSSLY